MRWYILIFILVYVNRPSSSLLLHLKSMFPFHCAGIGAFIWIRAYVLCVQYVCVICEERERVKEWWCMIAVRGLGGKCCVHRTHPSLDSSLSLSLSHKLFHVYISRKSVIFSNVTPLLWSFHNCFEVFLTKILQTSQTNAKISTY
jgi:hypothetical protein